MKTILRLVLVVAALLLFSSTAYAVCCSSCSGICADGTCGTPCCGYGSCNIFCCNCDDGCRTGSCTDCCDGADVMQATIDLFDNIDKNDDHAIDAREFQQWAGRSGRYFESERHMEKAFSSVDKNGDGKVDPAEFDTDLGKAYEKMNKTGG